ncbi:MAG TPA: hypothetical protein DIT28_01975, partial [Oxalobacteraceae bacterium]|nr:hypothetical protein [Oxalobacteraceae bacterium]
SLAFRQPMTSQRIAVVDKRPFFEKALCFGVQHDIVNAAKCQAIIADGAKGTLQVADHFGTSHLYSDLENARTRIVNLVSLYLEDSCGADLEKAACSLRENTFLFHSRSGNDMLKKLHAMPESTVYGDMKGQSLKDFQNERTLTNPFSLAAYRKELKRRQGNAAIIAAALWLADDMGIARSSLEFVSAEAVIRTAILVRFGGNEQGASRSQFAKLVEAVRSTVLASGKMRIPKTVLDDVPDEHREIVDRIRREMEKQDAPSMLNPAMALDVLMNIFESRYFMRETGLEDLDSFDAFVSKEWHQATGGKEDPYSRLTLFMCLAAGVKPKTTVSDVEARAMV